MQNDIQIIPIPAFEDNYIWLLHNQTQALVVDPGDADVVLETLALKKLTLTHILITHHHQDHIGGVEQLKTAFPQAIVYAPKHEKYYFNHVAVCAPDNIELLEFTDHGIPLKFKIIDVPGHTIGHIAYYSHPILFCGDTLFGAGCGRLFEGTPEQMYASLEKLGHLPNDTMVYCTHEYTLKNIHFALTLDPHNQQLKQRLHHTVDLRARNLASLPSTIGLENATNPFLRCHHLDIQNHAVNSMRDVAETTTVQLVNIFSAIRLKRNHY